MNIEELNKKFYESFNIDKLNQKYLNKLELWNLYKIPIRDRKNDSYHMGDYLNQKHQMDLLFMPNDKGFKYILVIVDVFSRFTEAEPLKNKNSIDVLRTTKKIYKRSKFLDYPKLIQVDEGTEFKGEFKKFMNNKNILIRYGKPGRHRQQAVVERKNQIIGKALFMRMTGIELINEENTNTEWKNHLQKIIDMINKKEFQRLKKRKKKADNIQNEDIKCKGETCKILEKGTKVREILDKPEDLITGKRLHGKFRSTDIRWNPEIKQIKEILLIPSQPILYLTEDKNGNSNNIAYTRNQLQKVHKDELEPKGKLLISDYDLLKEKKNISFRVKKIIDKKKINNKIYYRVRWYGYDENDDTWEEYNQLKQNKEVKKLINDFNKKIKNENINIIDV